MMTKYIVASVALTVIILLALVGVSGKAEASEQEPWQKRLDFYNLTLEKIGKVNVELLVDACEDEKNIVTAFTSLREKGVPYQMVYSEMDIGQEAHMVHLLDTAYITHSDESAHNTPLLAFKECLMEFHAALEVHKNNAVAMRDDLINQMESK